MKKKLDRKRYEISDSSYKQSSSHLKYSCCRNGMPRSKTSCCLEGRKRKTFAMKKGRHELAYSVWNGIEDVLSPEHPKSGKRNALSPSSATRCLPLVRNSAFYGCVFHTRCPLAQNRCFAETPPLRRLESGRRVACHLAE